MLSGFEIRQQRRQIITLDVFRIRVLVVLNHTATAIGGSLIWHGLTFGPAHRTTGVVQLHLPLQGAVVGAAEGDAALGLTAHTLAHLAVIHPGLAVLEELVQALRFAEGVRGTLLGDGLLVADLVANLRAGHTLAFLAPFPPEIFHFGFRRATRRRSTLVLAATVARGMRILRHQLYHHLVLVRIAVRYVAGFAHTLVRQTASLEVRLGDLLSVIVV